MQLMYINDPIWVAFDLQSELMSFFGHAIKRLMGSSIGKAVSQYGFLRMHPTNAAKMFASERHLIVTTRFHRQSDNRTFYRFAYDMGSKLYAAYMHSLFSPDFIYEVFNFNTLDPKEERLGDAVECLLGMFELWDSVPQCIPDNLEGPEKGPEKINEMRRGVEDSLLYFCSVGSEKVAATNRKSKRSKTIVDDIPKFIAGVPREINYLVPEAEGTGKFSPFVDLLAVQGEGVTGEP